MSAGAAPPTAHLGNTATPSHEAMEQAAAWFSLLQSGTATDADRARWHDWLNGAESNRAAWAFVERVGQRFQPLQGEASARLAADTLQTARSRLARRRIILGVAAMIGTGSMLGWGLSRQPGTLDGLLAWNADYRSSTGERREVRLTDGTRVWLASASAFDQDYHGNLRRLRLRNGEILIQTAADTRRPFVVDTAHGRLRALGTRFNVRLDDDGHTRLAVYEGAVQITLAASPATATVSTGQQLRFNAERLEPPAAADPAREAWARGILLAQDITLGEVIAELARYQRRHITVAPDVAALKVLGSYPLDDADGTLAMLQRTLPIQIRRPLPWWITVEAGSELSPP